MFDKVKAYKNGAIFWATLYFMLAVYTLDIVMKQTVIGIQ